MARKTKQVTIYSARKHFRNDELVQLNISLLFVLSSLVFLLTAYNTNFFLPKRISLKHFISNQSRTRVLAISESKDISLTPAASPTAAITPETTSTQDFCLQVPVLFYHHIEPYDLATQEGHQQLTVDSDYFDQQMNYLKINGYKSISAEDLAHALISHQQLPPKSVVITMDDGYVDIYTYAFPILKKYNMIGNLMIPAGLIDTSDYMTWKQLQEMVKDPHIKIYNHTYSHADLSNADADKLKAEIIVPNRELRDKLGITTDIFTYPYGAFSDTTIDFLKQHGFIAAFSTLPGAIQCQSQIMQLPRTRIGNAPLRDYGF